MRKTLNFLILCVAFTALFSSCVAKKKYTQLIGEKDSVSAMLADEKQKVSDLEGNVKTLETEKAELITQFDDERNSLNSTITSLEGEVKIANTNAIEAETKMKEALSAKDAELFASRQAINSVFTPYKTSGLSLIEKNNMLYVALATPILYRSGSARITKGSKPSIQNIAQVLMGNPKMSILVEGHTDNTPMKAGARYKDNLALSLARANTVVRELVKLGVSPNQVSAIGRGDYAPLEAVEGDIEANKNNRRAEIIVVPDVGSLYRMQ